jgi:hypothetical protein
VHVQPPASIAVFKRSANAIVSGSSPRAVSVISLAPDARSDVASSSA